MKKKIYCEVHHEGAHPLWSLSWKC